MYVRLFHIIQEGLETAPNFRRDTADLKHYGVCVTGATIYWTVYHQAKATDSSHLPRRFNTSETFRHIQHRRDTTGSQLRAFVSYDLPAPVCRT
jgi:hypothetical protein